MVPDVDAPGMGDPMKVRAWHLIVVALAVVAAGCSDEPPRPQLTMQLTPVGAPRSASELKAAATVMEGRLSALAKSEVVVEVRGDHLDVRGAVRVSSVLDAFLAPGRLEFRRVVEVEPFSAASPSATARARSGDAYAAGRFATLDCSDTRTRREDGPYQPSVEIVACDRLGVEKFHLAVAKVVGEDVSSAKAEQDPLGTEVQIDVALRGEGQKRFTELTRECFNAVPPTNRVAMVLDGLVYSAPTIQSVITGDPQITGGFTTAEGEALASVVSNGPLPFALAISDPAQ